MRAVVSCLQGGRYEVSAMLVGGKEGPKTYRVSANVRTSARQTLVRRQSTASHSTLRSKPFRQDPRNHSSTRIAMSTPPRPKRSLLLRTPREQRDSGRGRQIQLDTPRGRAAGQALPF